MTETNLILLFFLFYWLNICASGATLIDKRECQ